MSKEELLNEMRRVKKQITDFEIWVATHNENDPNFHQIIADWNFCVEKLKNIQQRYCEEK